MMPDPVRTACSKIVVLVAVVAACSGDGGGVREVLIDTVGGMVRVRNPASDDAVFTIGGSVRIGGGIDAGEPSSFGRVTGVTLLDGRIYVADGQARDIRVFDGDGNFLFRFGRQGEGPGEFAALDAVTAAPDGSILARDPRLLRVTRFDSEGRYLADYRLARPYMQFGDGTGFTIGRDGWFYDRLSLTLGIASDDSLAIIAYDDGGHVRDTINVMQTPRRFVTVLSDGLPSAGLPIPFGTVAIAAVAPDGRIARTEGTSFGFDILAPGGTPERRVELDVEPLAITSAQRDSALEAMRKLAGELTDGGRMEDFTFPERMAAITHLYADADGFWWAGANHASNRSRPPDRFEIFDPGGIHVGNVAVGFLPILIGHDRIAGIARDSLGVESVIVASLRRPG